MPLLPPERLLISTARSTFESLALLYADAAPPAEPPDGTALAAHVAFSGVADGESVEGVLAVAVTDDVAAALAENMLGAAAAGPTERRDAVGEFANVVCGHVLSAAAGPEAVFSLAAPAPAPGAAVGDGPRAVWRAWLDVEGGRACVTLDVPDTFFPAHAGDAPAGAPAGRRAGGHA